MASLWNRNSLEGEKNHSTILNQPPLMNVGKLERCYFLTCAVVFFLTAGAKLWSASLDSRALTIIEPITSLRYGDLFVAVALVEIIIGVLIILPLSRSKKYAAIGVFIFTGLAFHVARYAANVSMPCPCMGELLSWSPWLNEHQSEVAVAALLIMAVSLAALLLIGWRSNSASNPN